MDRLEKLKTLGIMVAVAALIKYKKSQQEAKVVNPKRKIVKPKRVWCKERFRMRYTGKDLSRIGKKELHLEDPKSFANCFKVTKEQFEKLLCLVGPLIKKQDTIMREAITPEIRLMITLRYLATGISFCYLSNEFSVGRPSISIFVPETLYALYKVLSQEYLKGCQTADEWKTVAQDFETKWDFPMCLGAIDGKHIAIKAKTQDVSQRRNYQGFNSIILLAVVDANGKFIMVDVIKNGVANDEEAFESADIGTVIKENQLNFPDDEELAGTDVKVPYVFVSNDMFCLSPRILNPYIENCSEEMYVFNYRLSTARQVVDDAFGMLCNRFQLLQKVISLSAEKAEMVTLCCCALHNYLMSEIRVHSLPERTMNLASLEKSTEDVCSESASSETRDIFCDYFHKMGMSLPK